MSALEKLLKGEQLTEEEQKSLTDEDIAKAKQSKLDEIKALHAEKQRQQDLISKRDQDTASDFSKKFLDEQTSKAETLVFTELSGQGIELTEEKKSKIRDMRKRLDSGVVTFENIADDYRSAAAAVDNRVLFEDRRKRMDFEKNAQRFTANQAGAGGTGAPGNETDKQYPQEAWDMVAEAQRQGLALSPEEALNSLTRGMRRIHKQ